MNGFCVFHQSLEVLRRIATPLTDTHHLSTLIGYIVEADVVYLPPVTLQGAALAEFASTLWTAIRSHIYKKENAITNWYHFIGTMLVLLIPKRLAGEIDPPDSSFCHIVV